MADINALTDTFNAFVMENCVNTISYTNCIPSEISISTMTLSIHTNVQVLHEQPLFKRRYENDKENILKSLSSSLLVFEERPSKFRNCVIFRSSQEKSNGSKVIKIFDNGNMQINGVKNFHQLNSLIPNIVNCLNFTYSTDAVEVLKIDIQMINSSCYIGGAISLEKLYTAAVERGLHVKYNTEIHPGLKYKFPSMTTKGSNVTVIVFTTGKTIITGAKTFDDIQLGFEWIVGMYDTLYSILHLSDSDVMRYRKKRALPIEDFYTLTR
jgi:TATA-box binding protein (TBP) (component of TFIID and TFIIIB)